MLIETELNELLNEIVGKAFAINRRLDRIKSVVKVEFKLVNTSRVLHSLSHEYPIIFGDRVADYQEQSNCVPVYPATPVGDENYISISECLAVYLQDLFDYRDLIEITIDKSIELKDRTTNKLLSNILFELKDYISQSQDLVDIFLKCKNPIDELMLDANISAFTGK